MNRISTFRKIYVFTLLLSAACIGFAQSIIQEGKLHINYTMQLGGGTNGCAVVWVPTMSAYATVIAGNAEFPLEFFSTKGAPISQYQAGLDIRGMWWDASKKVLMANAAGDAGWYKISPDGFANGSSWDLVRDGQLQPEFQSVMTSTGKGVIGYSEGQLFFYTKSGKLKKQIDLANYPGNIADLNYTTVGYTGDSKFPVALLNHAEKKVELFDLKGNYLGGSVLPVENGLDLSAFRFSIANRMAWIYDVQARTWTAYRIIQ